jgi:GT2 family glycosyltransferase
MATRAKARWLGELEGLQDGLAFGWCIDTEQPDARAVIEICVNDECIGTLTADVARGDLATRFEKAGGRGVDVCHGFVADLRALAGELPAVITARVANATQVLPGRLRIEEPSAPPAPAANFVFGDGGLRLQGWCAHRDRQAGAMTVRAFVGAREVATAVADQRHPTLRAFGMETDGFTLDLPPELADGRTHLVRVVDENGAPLNGSPVTVCCFLSGARALLPAAPHGALEAVIDSYERYLPRSLGLEFYATWRREFEGDAKFAASKLRAGLIVPKSADAAATKRTLASIAAQQGAKVAVFTDAREAMASGCDVIGFVRPGDELRAHAIAAALEAFGQESTQLAYTDSEFEGRPWFKPAWNLDYALASDYPLELLLARREFAKANLPPRPASASPAAFAWRWLAAASQLEDAIVHVPRALYVWNSAPTPLEKKQRTAAAEAALQAIDSPCALAPIDVEEPLFQPRRMLRPLSRAERKTAVSLIIPTRDRVDLLASCIRSIRKYTQWPALEIIVVDNHSVELDTQRFLRSAKKQGVRVIPHPGAFNFSAMNNRAVEAAKGSIVGLINNDIEALHEGWLDEIVGQLLRPGVGAVGAKLVWPNGMVQHAGVLLGVGNAAGHFGNRLADADWGDHGRNQLAQQVSAVTAACLFLRKKDYIAVRGMDETTFPVTFNDVDLCLKLRARGDAIVFTPFARLLHAESASRGKDDAPPQRARAQREMDRLRERWGAALLRDPAYHPSLNLDAHSHPFGGLAIPPRERRPRTGALPV